MENIKKGIEPMEAIEKASGTYGRFDEAVKKIDPREEKTIMGNIRDDKNIKMSKTENEKRAEATKLLIEYMNLLPSEIIEDAIYMYERGRNFEKIKEYLDYELDKREQEESNETEKENDGTEIEK